MVDKENSARPSGELALQTLTMPADTNANGDIFGGWLVSQMDLAAGIATKIVAQGRSATVAIENVTFLIPVNVGEIVSCYTKVLRTGRTSIGIGVEVWMTDFSLDNPPIKVATGHFIFVAIDEDGRPRELPPQVSR